MISLTELQCNPEEYVKTLKLEDIVKFIKKANHAYFETDKQLISDGIYDIIIDRLKESIRIIAY